MVELHGPDPLIAMKLTLLMLSAQSMQGWWIDVSYQLCFAYVHFRRLLDAQIAELRDNAELRAKGKRRRRKSYEQFLRRSEQLGESQVLWKDLSQRWQELECAIRLLCDNTGLDWDWLFSQTDPAGVAVEEIRRPDSIIELARKIVDPDASPNPEIVKYVYRELRKHLEYPNLSDQRKRE
jgi:hypothetical protein